MSNSLKGSHSTKHPHLSLADKYNIIKKAETVRNKAAVAPDFNVKSRAVDYIITRRK